MREEIFKRQRQLALAFPFDTGLTIPEISVLSVYLAKAYARVSEKTLQRDAENLIDLQLLKKSGDKYYANSDIIKSMIAKRK
jgi:hypothetical protein